MNIGIDAISFYTPAYYLDLKTLAAARGVDPDKYVLGIGQERMSVPPPDEDAVTQAASAARRILARDGARDIELLLFATETGVDQSKAAALFVHGLLDLPARCRAVELKQACYSGTAGLQLAVAWIARNPGKRALILASDIARYELRSPGESTQGAGAVALLVSENPRLVELDPASGFVAEDVMDFWRPNYREEALVDGPYSTRLYLHTLSLAWQQYTALSGLGYRDHDRFCYHLPFTRIAAKAQSRLARECGEPEPSADDLRRLTGDALTYNRITGNTYSASLYEGLAALLDTSAEPLDGLRAGFFSYGSGCMGEFFGGRVRPGYRDHLFAKEHRAMLDGRTELFIGQYEDLFHMAIPRDGGEHLFAQYRTGPFRLSGISQHKRVYEEV
jgi:hydroxymethylglutaryl-CoA synthase